MTSSGSQLSTVGATLAAWDGEVDFADHTLSLGALVFVQEQTDLVGRDACIHPPISSGPFWGRDGGIGNGLGPARERVSALC